MKVDCHTHLWRAEHWSAEMIREAEIARGGPVALDITEEDHWTAMQAVDRAIVFGLYALHSGITVPNDFVDDDADGAWCNIIHNTSSSVIPQFQNSMLSSVTSFRMPMTYPW